MKAACQPPKPYAPDEPVQDALLHQLGVLELLVQHSAVLLHLAARAAAAAAVAAAVKPPTHGSPPSPIRESGSSQCAETACLADDAASQCCQSRCGRRKRARDDCSGNEEGCGAVRHRAWKKASPQCSLFRAGPGVTTQVLCSTTAHTNARLLERVFQFGRGGGRQFM